MSRDEIERDLGEYAHQPELLKSSRRLRDKLLDGVPGYASSRICLLHRAGNCRVTKVPFCQDCINYYNTPSVAHHLPSTEYTLLQCFHPPTTTKHSGRVFEFIPMSKSALLATTPVDCQSTGGSSQLLDKQIQGETTAVLSIEQQGAQEPVSHAHQFYTSMLITFV